MADARNSLVAVGIARRNVAKSMADVDRDTIAAIRCATGTVSVTEIARLVGVDRSTVYRMLERDPANSVRPS